MAEFLGISSVAHMAVRVLEKHKGVVSMSFTAAVSSAHLCRQFWGGCAQQSSHLLPVTRLTATGRRQSKHGPGSSMAWQQADVPWAPGFCRSILWNEVGQGLLCVSIWEIKNFFFVKVSALSGFFCLFVSAGLHPAATPLPLCGIPPPVCTILTAGNQKAFNL